MIRSKGEVMPRKLRHVPSTPYVHLVSRNR